MRRLMKSRSVKTGLPPGALVHVGERKVEAVKVRVFEYDEAQLREEQLSTPDECVPPGKRSTITWVDVEGLHDVEALGRLGERFGLHPLVVEDLLNTGQRPKAEDLDEYIFVVLKTVCRSHDGGDGTDVEQVSLVLGPNYVLTFQEREGDAFDPIRDRIRHSRGRVRRMGADYLAYALIDAIVDHYFLVLEWLGERLESLEDQVAAAPTTETQQVIHHLKTELIFLRRSAWPLREVVGGLERSESSLIQETTGVYLRDVYDHAIQVIEALETFRDMLSGMLDIYLSSVSNRMNEVMKVLTIIATVFIPLTFVAGVYGMNFRHMPELEWVWGYPLVWIVMIVVAGLMVIYFRRKRWL